MDRIWWELIRPQLGQIKTGGDDQMLRGRAAAFISESLSYEMTLRTLGRN